MHYVYILRCADGSLYIGLTSHLELRLINHNEGRASTFTATRRPVTMVYSEACATRRQAAERERQLKRWTRKKKEVLIAGDIVRLTRS